MKYLSPGTGFCTLMLYCLTEKFVYCLFTIRLKQITKASQSFVHLFTRSLNPFYALDKPFKRNFYLFNVLEKMFNSLSAANYFNVFCHVTLKNHISGVIYSSISSYTSLEREKNTLSKKKYFGHRKPIIFRHKKI